MTAGSRQTGGGGCGREAGWQRTRWEMRLCRGWHSRQQRLTCGGTQKWAASPEEHWYYTSAALGWVGSSSPQIRGANVKRLYGKVECDEELRHQHNCGGRKGKLQPPAVCATCNHGQETAAHMMQHCRCTQMRGRRQLFWRQYDAHMMRQPRAGSKREKLRWSQSPSLGMQRKLRLQNQG